MKKEYIQEIKTIGDLNAFFKMIAFSTSYALESANSIVEYQEYSKLNNLHLYSVTDFIDNEDYEEKSIILERQDDKNMYGWKIKYIFNEID